MAPCPGCGCGEPGGATTHAVVAAMASGDLDRAIALGLLDCPACNRCSTACTDALRVAREARLGALAARERHRSRNARLQRRAAELAVKRGAATETAPVDAPTSMTARPALPAAAALALARAKARAGERHKP